MTLFTPSSAANAAGADIADVVDWCWSWCCELDDDDAAAARASSVDGARINLSIHRQTICCSLSSLEYLSRAECDEWNYARKLQEQKETQKPMHNEK